MESKDSVSKGAENSDLLWVLVYLFVALTVYCD
jgi:hypothetical protein